MKVLFLSAGNSIHTVKWVNALAEQGLEVHLIYNKGHEPMQDKLNEKVKGHCLKYGGGPAYYLNALELRNLSKEIDPDVINVHYASGYGTLARHAKIGPILLSIWGSDVYSFPYESKTKNRILKKNIKYADMLASTSECMAKQLREVMEDEDLKISITPFGVDLNHFKSTSPKRENKDNIIIGNIKALNPVYGIDILIDSLPLLFKQLNEEGYERIARKIKVFIYGEGEQKEELVKKVEDLKLHEIVAIKGRIPNVEVPKTLETFDIFCTTSIRESFGVAVVEAMAMGVPVVVSDADGLKEVVEDNVTGIIVPKNDREKTASALKELIIDAKRCEQYGKAGRKRVEEFYDWEQNVSIMIGLYGKYLKE